jgi:hypothetical protein
MGIFLGDKPVTVFFNGAAAGLPVQGVFLGGVQVFPTGTAATVLYFDGDADDDWTNVANWWLDDEFSEPAGRLPTSADSVVATRNINASGQTVVNFTLDDQEQEGYTLLGTLTVTGNATFSGFSYNGGTVTGNVTFNDATANDGGTVIGTATFNHISANTSSGTIIGNATFNNNSQNQAAVTGTATFNDSACNSGGTAGTFIPNPPPSCP